MKKSSEVKTSCTFSCNPTAYKYHYTVTSQGELKTVKAIIPELNNQEVTTVVRVGGQVVAEGDSWGLQQITPKTDNTSRVRFVREFLGIEIPDGATVDISPVYENGAPVTKTCSIPHHVILKMAGLE